jgi:phenylacetate-CoA ligase
MIRPVQETTRVYGKLFRQVLFPAYEAATGRGTHRLLAEYSRNQWLDGETLASIQLEKTNALLDFCWANVPYLKKRWQMAGLRPRRLESIHELEEYPILSKAEITANYGEMTSLPWRGRSMSKTTGGSSGDPFRFEYTMESYARRTAVMWRGYEWAGAGLGTRTAYLWGGAPSSRGLRGFKDRAYHRAFNRRFFDAFSMHEQNIEEYARRMSRFRPDALVGYVRPVVVLAEWLNATGMKVPGLSSVVTGAEALYEPERALIENAFECPVFNTYGCREVMLIASECEMHAGLHMNADHLVVEVVDPAGRAVRREPGDVVVTDLHNLAMPLVRYRNGDRATLRGGACSCGRGLPMLESVDGRVLDLIATPDGRQVPGEMFVTIMLGMTGIRRFQVVQVAPDVIELRLVLAAALAQCDRDRLADRLREAVGGSMQVHVREVASIEEPASGKRRVTVSLESFRAQQALG